MSFTIVFTDADGADLERAAFCEVPPCAAICWAADMVASASGVEGAVVTGWRVEVPR